MTSLTSRLGLIKPNDVVGIEDDLVDVTAQIADSYDKIDAAVGLFPYTGSKPATNNYNGRLIFNTSTGEIHRWNGTTWKFFHDTEWQTWNPGWTFGNAAGALGNGTLVGRYFRIGKRVSLKVDLTFGSTTNGGSGYWSFTGPAGWAYSVIHKGVAGLVCTGGRAFGGFMTIDAANSIQMQAINDSSVSGEIFPLRNADVSAATGTGVPKIAGVFSFSTGSTASGTVEAEVNQATYDAW